MFGLTKQVSIALLSFTGSIANIVNTDGYIKCVSLNNQ